MYLISFNINTEFHLPILYLSALTEKGDKYMMPPITI